MILCLSGMFLSDTGVPGAGDIVRGSSISLERLKNNIELISTGQKWRGTYILWSSITFFCHAFSASLLPIDRLP